MMRDTVFFDTPANRAMSLMVAALPGASQALSSLGVRDIRVLPGLIPVSGQSSAQRPELRSAPTARAAAGSGAQQCRQPERHLREQHYRQQHPEPGQPERPDRAQAFGDGDLADGGTD